MTIKEAFEKLHKAVKKSGMNPFFLIGNLKDEFKDIADNVVDGADVEVVPAQSSGYLVGNVKVNGKDNYLFAPPQVIPPHIYDNNERLAAVWFHDGISEDVYEKTFSLDNISTSSSTPDELIPASYFIFDAKPNGIYTVSGTSYVFDDLIFVNSVNNDVFNLRLSLQKGNDYYTIFKEGSGTISNAVLILRYIKRNN